MVGSFGIRQRPAGERHQRGELGLPKSKIGGLAVLLLLPLLVFTAPLWLTVTAALDVLTGLRRLPTVRLGLFAVVYISYGWVALFTSLYLWLAAGFGRRLNSPSSMNKHRVIQRWWGGSLLRWARRLLNVHIEFADAPDLPSGTFILASRHASMVDAILPIPLVTGRLDRFVHYILKDELRWDPAIGTFGPRLNSVFVARGRDTDGDLAGIRSLALDAQPGAAIVIYPEGTYANRANRARILASIRRKADQGEIDPMALKRAEAFEHLLPPKTLGITELQNALPDAPIVVMGHVGLEGVSELGGLRHRLPLSQPVRVQWQVFNAADVPADDHAFESWLNDTWAELDQWVDSELTGSEPPG